MAIDVQAFFSLNRTVILFAYGQVFFVMGLAIALQSWKHSRLPLARNVNWLAAFGLTHGLHEWGHVFIPVQAEYMPAGVIDLLYVAQTALLAISYASLYEFGVRCLRPLPDHQRLLRYLPAASLAVWVFLAVGPTQSLTVDAGRWHDLNSIWARYLLGFPGSVVAAGGLRRQSRLLAMQMDVPRIRRTLDVAGLALIGYGVTAGLAVPPGSFFPADRFNATTVERLTLVPVEVYRSLFGLAMAVAVVRVLEVVEIEFDRRLAGMEEAHVLAIERARIGRDLHDGTLQKVYSAGLMLQAADRELTEQGVSGVGTHVRHSIDLLNSAVTDIRAFIGNLSPQSSSRSLAAGLEELTAARHLRSVMEVELARDLPEDRPLTPSEVGHLLAIASEALSNAARHAQATRTRVTISATDDRLRLEVEDNGSGMPSDIVLGYGLRNIHDRAHMLGGEVAIDTQRGQGTTVTVDVPWPAGNGLDATAHR